MNLIWPTWKKIHDPTWPNQYVDQARPKSATRNKNWHKTLKKKRPHQTMCRSGWARAKKIQPDGQVKTRFKLKKKHRFFLPGPWSSYPGWMPDCFYNLRGTSEVIICINQYSIAVGQSWVTSPTNSFYLLIFFYIRPSSNSLPRLII